MPASNHRSLIAVCKGKIPVCFKSTLFKIIVKFTKLSTKLNSFSKRQKKKTKQKERVIMQTLTSVTSFLTPVLHCWVWTESIVVPLLTHINWRDICAGWTQRSRCDCMHNLCNVIPISLNAIDYSISIILKEAVKKSIVVNLSLSSKKLFCTTRHCQNFFLICPSQDFFWQQKYKHMSSLEAISVISLQ